MVPASGGNVLISETQVVGPYEHKWTAIAGKYDEKSVMMYCQFY